MGCHAYQIFYRNAQENMCHRPSLPHLSSLKNETASAVDFNPLKLDFMFYTEFIIKNLIELLRG